MRYERYIAYGLIAIGALALLARLDNGSGWLWVGLVAAGFLAAYASQRSYGFLVVGGILAGVALGILLEGSWGLEGFFLLSLGAGFFAIQRIEPQRGRWPMYAAAVLFVLGLFVMLVESGILGSIWFALILVGVGLYLLTRRQEPDASDARPGGWVEVPPIAPETSSEAPTPGPIVEPEIATGAAETEAEAVSTVSREDDQPLEGEARRRYERLESWRKRQAASDGSPAYLVLNNETMERIARENPRSLQELKGIKGIGPVKLERYGEEILRVLQE